MDLMNNTKTTTKGAEIMTFKHNLILSLLQQEGDTLTTVQLANLSNIPVMEVRYILNQLESSHNITKTRQGYTYIKKETHIKESAKDLVLGLTCMSIVMGYLMVLVVKSL